MGSLTLTTPELALLAGEGGLLREACPLPQADESVAPAALATLFSRGLIDMTEQDGSFVGAAALLAASLSELTAVITISQVTEDGGTAVLLVTSDRASFVISPRLLGCFEIDMLAVPADQVCQEMVAGLLQPAADVLIAVERRAADRTDGLAVRSGATGGLQLITSDGPSGPQPATQPDVVAALDAILSGG